MNRLFKAKFGLTLFRPVKSIPYLELVSCNRFAHTELALHLYRSTHSSPEFMPTHLQAIKFPMVSNNRYNGNSCGLTFALDNTRTNVLVDENSGINACRLWLARRLCLRGHLDDTASTARIIQLARHPLCCHFAMMHHQGKENALSRPLRLSLVQ